MKLEAHRGITFFYSPDNPGKLERLAINPLYFGRDAFIDILRHQYREDPNGITIVSEEGSITYLPPVDFTTQISRSKDEIDEKITEVVGELLLADRVIFEAPQKTTPMH